ncbi:hypothetical protein BaRGS_00021615 [Batillaria attramentaria]|uniref:Uncharacterized protein n=1 Tax=Batillaria attramentaria TaxID=370345 RepID=A0ABD0KK23_9CAEN
MEISSFLFRHRSYARARSPNVKETTGAEPGTREIRVRGAREVTAKMPSITSQQCMFLVRGDDAAVITDFRKGQVQFQASTHPLTRTIRLVSTLVPAAAFWRQYPFSPQSQSPLVLSRADAGCWTSADSTQSRGSKYPHRQHDKHADRLNRPKTTNTHTQHVIVLSSCLETVALPTETQDTQFQCAVCCSVEI